MSSLLDDGDASKRFSFIVVSNKKGSCETKPILPRSELNEKSRTLISPIDTAPFSTS